jgi:hypothetical protein
MDIDPDELLTWLKGDDNGERDLQIIALEQLCKCSEVPNSYFRILVRLSLGMLVLMSDNIDRNEDSFLR